MGTILADPTEAIRAAAQSRLTVLFESQTAVVIDKPAWLLVHSSSWAGPRERTVMTLVREQLGDGLAPVHRLDRQTSGALLLAKGSRAAHAWQRALSEDRAHKRYLAIVRGCVQGESWVDHALTDEDGVAREARSLVRPLCTREGEARSSLVSVRTFTGRTHQVRRHLKHLSHPILGDSNYGKQPLNRWFRERFALPRLALHSASLAVERDDGERIVVDCDLADDLAGVCDRLFDDRWRTAVVDEGPMTFAAINDQTDRAGV